MFRGFPFPINSDDMQFIEIQDIYRNYQFLKMFLKKVIDNKILRKTVLEALKSTFILNFNKTQHCSELRPTMENKRRIEQNFMKSAQLQQQVDELRKLNYSIEEIRTRLLLREEMNEPNIKKKIKF